MKYDVFISYRRVEGRGLEIARIIDSQIDNTLWYRAFLDYNELKDQEWSPKIFEAIDSAPVFLFIMTEGSLDRCADEKDCVRQEILRAVQQNKHIIPVNPEGKFKWGDIREEIRKDIPEEIRKALFDNQQSEISLGQLFKPSISKLVKERIRPYVPRVIFLKRLLFTSMILATVLLLIVCGSLIRKRRAFNRDYQEYVECLNESRQEKSRNIYSEDAVIYANRADSIANAYQDKLFYSYRFGEESNILVDSLFDAHKARAVKAYKTWEKEPDNMDEVNRFVDLALRLRQDETLKQYKRILTNY